MGDETCINQFCARCVVEAAFDAHTHLADRGKETDHLSRTANASYAQMACMRQPNCLLAIGVSVQKSKMNARMPVCPSVCLFASTCILRRRHERTLLSATAAAAVADYPTSTARSYRTVSGGGGIAGSAARRGGDGRSSSSGVSQNHAPPPYFLPLLTNEPFLHFPPCEHITRQFDFDQTIILSPSYYSRYHYTLNYILTYIYIYNLYIYIYLYQSRKNTFTIELSIDNSLEIIEQEEVLTRTRRNKRSKHGLQ